MAIDDVIGIGERYADISRIGRGFDEKNNDYKLLKEYAKNYWARDPEDKEEVDMYAKNFEKTAPALMQKNMDLKRAVIGKTLADIVESNLGEILSEGSETAEQAAYAVAGIAYEEREIKRCLAKKDTKGVKALYINLYGADPSVKQFAEEIADNEFFMKYYPRALADRKESFLSQFAEKQGDKSVVNENKLKSYIRAKLGEMKDEERPMAYTEIGLTLYGHELFKQQLKAAEKAAKEEAKKSKGKKDKK